MQLTEKHIDRFLNNYHWCAPTQRKNEVWPKVLPLLQKFAQHFSAENDDLIDFILQSDHRQVALSMLSLLTNLTLEESVGTNPVIQDELADYQYIRHYSVGVSNYDALSAEQKTEVENMAESMVNRLINISDHIQIGKELGMEGKKLGVYDAMIGWFAEPFNPRVLAAARKLNKWMFSEQVSSMTDDERIPVLGTMLTQLAQEYQFEYYRKEMTTSYIASEIMQWELYKPFDPQAGEDY